MPCGSIWRRPLRSKANRCANSCFSVLQTCASDRSLSLGLISIKRDGHHARPAVVRILGFQTTRTFRANSGRHDDIACSRHHIVIPRSVLSNDSVRTVFLFGDFTPRIQVGNLNSSCAKRLVIYARNYAYSRTHGKHPHEKNRQILIFNYQGTESCFGPLSDSPLSALRPKVNSWVYKRPGAE